VTLLVKEAEMGNVVMGELGERCWSLFWLKGRKLTSGDG